MLQAGSAPTFTRSQGRTSSRPNVRTSLLSLCDRLSRAAGNCIAFTSNYLVASVAMIMSPPLELAEGPPAGLLLGLRPEHGVRRQLESACTNRCNRCQRRGVFLLVAAIVLHHFLAGLEQLGEGAVCAVAAALACHGHQEVDAELGLERYSWTRLLAYKIQEIRISSAATSKKVKKEGKKLNIPLKVMASPSHTRQSRA